MLIKKKWLTSYSADQMLTLVNDIPNYPQFLPGCLDAKINKQHNNWLEAQLLLKKGKLQYLLITENIINNNQIDIKLVKGPLHHLNGYWQFKSVPHGCYITLYLDFSIKNIFLNLAMQPFLTQISTKIQDAFCQRANLLFGC